MHYAGAVGFMAKKKENESEPITTVAIHREDLGEMAFLRGQWANKKELRSDGEPPQTQDVFRELCVRSGLLEEWSRDAKRRAELVKELTDNPPPGLAEKDRTSFDIYVADKKKLEAVLNKVAREKGDKIALWVIFRHVCAGHIRKVAAPLHRP